MVGDALAQQSKVMRTLLKKHCMPSETVPLGLNVVKVSATLSTIVIELFHEERCMLA